jgi:phytoene dehydrogenase-like protein
MALTSLVSHGTGEKFDAVVVGSGPNGLTAAIVLARAGLSTLVLEASESIGGGCRTAELTLPGFHHDVCAAIHPMGVLSPIFRELGLEKQGLKWVQTPAPLAHPLPDGEAALLHHSLEETAAGFGGDAASWRGLFGPLLKHQEAFFSEIFQPLRIPAHPLLMTRFGWNAIRPAEAVMRRFQTVGARALFAGCAAHSVLPLTRAGTASFGLVLALAGYAVGWPCARGGSQRIIDALERCFRGLGGQIQTGRRARSWREIPAARVVLFDLAPGHVARIAGDELPASYIRRLREFKHGPGVFKVDWALDGPIPWKDARCGLAATVHAGGTAEEVMRSEHLMGRGEISESPFVLVAQQSLFDASRAPAGSQTGWAYCHVPAGCRVNMTERIERQIERFAPGFRDRIVARHSRGPKEYEEYNANFIGGDIGGGANTLGQFLFRPVARWNPYATPNPRFYLCSSSTPPGGGVHGMCGYWAARSALRRGFGLGEKPLV